MTQRPYCVLLGAGGHARMLLEALRSMDAAGRYAILDRDPAGWGRDMDGVPVVGGDDRIGDLMAAGADSFVVGVGAVGDNGPRERLFAWARGIGLAPLAVIHRSAICSGAARIDPGAQLLPGCIVNRGAHVGENAIVNSGAIIEHDCDVEPHAHVASGAILAGGVCVGRGAHIGAGATVRQGIRVGAGAVVGAGSVVVEDIPAGAKVAGVPARPLAGKTS